MASGEDCNITDVAPPVAQRDCDVGRVLADADTFALHDAEVVRRAPVRHQRFNQTRDVISIDTPGHEAIWVGAQRCVRSTYGKPAPKMIWLVRQGTHVRRPHI